jgi:hypothetical protein
VSGCRESYDDPGSCCYSLTPVRGNAQRPSPRPSIMHPLVPSHKAYLPLLPASHQRRSRVRRLCVGCVAECGGWCPPYLRSTSPPPTTFLLSALGATPPQRTLTAADAHCAAVAARWCASRAGELASCCHAHLQASNCSHTLPLHLQSGTSSCGW